MLRSFNVDVKIAEDNAGSVYFNEYADHKWEVVYTQGKSTYKCRHINFVNESPYSFETLKLHLLDYEHTFEYNHDTDVFILNIQWSATASCKFVLIKVPQFDEKNFQLTIGFEGYLNNWDGYKNIRSIHEVEGSFAKTEYDFSLYTWDNKEQCEEQIILLNPAWKLYVKHVYDMIAKLEDINDFDLFIKEDIEYNWHSCRVIYTFTVQLNDKTPTEKEEVSFDSILALVKSKKMNIRELLPTWLQPISYVSNSLTPADTTVHVVYHRALWKYTVE